VTGLVVTDRLLRLARTAALRTFRTPRDTTSIVVSGAGSGQAALGGGASGADIQAGAGIDVI